MQKPGIREMRTVCELPRGENNPRNSEGDFAVLRGGEILFAYSRYVGSDAHDDAACDVAGLLSRDGGETFAPLPEPLARAADHGVKNIMSVSLKRLPNGELCLFYLCKHTPQSEMYLRRAVGDETAFGPPERVFPCRDGIYYVVNNCRVCVTRDGRVLLPAALHRIVRRENGEASAEYYAASQIFEADGDGRNWRALPHVFRLRPRGHSETGLQEPGLAELPDGALYAYFRTDRGFQYESLSTDGGAHWTAPVQSRFSSPPSPMLIARNPYTGLYYAFWNPVPNYYGRLDSEARWITAGRTPFVTAVSENGRDFSPCAALETDPGRGYCYPAAYFLNEKTLLLSYCCGSEDDDMCLTRTRIARIGLA